LKALGDEGATLATALIRSYRNGTLRPARWEALTGRPASSSTEVDDSIRRLWDALAEEKLAKPFSVDEGRLSPARIRRWAWQPRWYLMEQDEDLLLMGEELVPVLLEVARDPLVPKREYLIYIVSHTARDNCCYAVWWGREVDKTLRKVAGWAPQAREVGAEELARYLERLGGYAVPAPVDREGAVQRLVDLARCSPPSPEEVKLREADGGWEGWLLHSAGNKWVRIDAATGSITKAKRPRSPSPRGGSAKPRQKT
jgi:hypothetical protein